MLSLLIFTTLSYGIAPVLAAECQTATVGQPFSTCWDIAVANNINTDQLIQYNPGLNCGALQVGQKLCVTPGDLPSTAPEPNPDGSCKTYKTVEGDYCALIGTKFGITAAQIEQFNVNTYKWKGCNNLQLDYTLCVSPGTPPLPEIIPGLQCGPQSPSRGDCPLRACCSAFGFCGITDEFCGKAPNGDDCISNCETPTLPSCDGAQLNRKVGYYAGWAAKRSCNPVGVDQLDLDGLTHVIYSFAVIKQDMKIGFDDTADSDRLRELVARAGSTKVLVAVGGWAFSQDEPTRDLFSIMISTQANRATFIASAKAFITEYKIAGIDIDFEYPASVERKGPPTDTPNLTTFFREFRAGLGNAEITLATPAGYWFLKGFELDKISENLDFINMMSYDYHGPWDTDVPGEDSVANPQSSLEDMKASTLLYVKAGVDLKKVNLGLAWYGRTFKLLDPSCTGYRCDMTGGGTKGKCTGESGVLANFEITALEEEADVRPRLDTKSQTRWFNHNGDLITYDDEGTWKAKTDFAKSTCFGGTMIWSLDQVIPKYSIPGNAQEMVDIPNSFGFKWTIPEAGKCQSYGNREYTSILYTGKADVSWQFACDNSPIIIKGVTYAHPDDCEQLPSGIIRGKWIVSSDDSHCKPNWGSNANDGCIGPGKRKWYSRLWDIPWGEDWMVLCTSSPNEIDGQTYNKPTYCDDKGILGAWGVWEVDDRSCSGNWGWFKDNGCADELGKREWSSKLFDAVGDWEDACKARDAVVEDSYFDKPSRCDKHITGVWGVFMVQDSTCGVPPCPDDKTWDYHEGACMACNGLGRSFAVTRELRTPRLNFTSPLNFTKRSDAVNASFIQRRELRRRAGCDAFHLPRPQPDYFPNNPLAWLTQQEGPTAAEIASSTQARRAFQEAWNDSFNTRTTAREVGGWIYADPNNPQRIAIRRAQANRSRPMHQLRPATGVSAAIDLNDPESNPGQPPAGMVLVANFHTHPMGPSYSENRQDIPSLADQQNAWRRGVPGIIISRRGLRAYGPQARAMLNAPRGYPMSGEDYGGQNAEGTQIGGDWRPTRAPNQQEE